jgi:hypothetical protein
MSINNKLPIRTRSELPRTPYTRSSQNSPSRTSVNKAQDGVLSSRSDYQDGAVSVPDDRVGDATHKRTLYPA